VRQKCTYAGIITRGVVVKVINKKRDAVRKEKKRRPACAGPANPQSEFDNSYQ
jgi:hypothetical protein